MAFLGSGRFQRPEPSTKAAIFSHKQVLIFGRRQGITEAWCFFVEVLDQLKFIKFVNVVADRIAPAFQ